VSICKWLTDISLTNLNDEMSLSRNVERSAAGVMQTGLHFKTKRPKIKLVRRFVVKIFCVIFKKV
jgi:hypothetical protein